MEDLIHGYLGRLLAVAAVLFAVGGGNPAPAAGGEISDCRELRVSGPPAWPPFLFAGKDGGPRTGPGVDVVQRAFADTGVTVVIEQPRPWKRVLNDLESGRTDLIMTWLDGSERREKFIYSRPWAEDVYGAIIHADRSFAWSEVSDFRAKRGGMYLGARLPKPLDQVRPPEYQVEEVPSGKALYRMLLKGRIDYLLISVPAFFELVPYGKGAEKLRVLKGSTVRLPIHMAFSRKSPCAGYLEHLNAVLGERYETWLAAAPWMK